MPTGNSKAARQDDCRKGDREHPNLGRRGRGEVDDAGLGHLPASCTPASIADVSSETAGEIFYYVMNVAQPSDGGKISQQVFRSFL